MTENKRGRHKPESLKTECSLVGRIGEMEFGKPVRLPYIRKISNSGHHPTVSRRSLEGQEGRPARLTCKGALDQTQIHMLTLQEI